MIHDKVFHDELRRTADEMMRGEHPEYNQANGCVCRVGITLTKLGVNIDEPADTYGFVRKFTGYDSRHPLDSLYCLRAPTNKSDRDQTWGADGIYEYLKEIEYV